MTHKLTSYAHDNIKVHKHKPMMKWEVFPDTEHCPLCEQIVKLTRVNYMGDHRYPTRYRCVVCLMTLRPQVNSSFAKTRASSKVR